MHAGRAELTAIAGWSMVLGPVAIVGGDALNHLDHGRAAQAAFFIGFLLLIPAVLGLVRLLRLADGARYGVAGGALAVLGCLLCAAATGPSTVGVDVPVSFTVLFAPLALGLLLLCAALYAARAVPRPFPTAIAVACVFGMLNAVLALEVSAFVEDSILLMGLAPVGALVLSEGPLAGLLGS